MKSISKLNKPRIFFLFLAIVALAFFSFMLLFSREEGVALEGPVKNFLADIFAVFLFPTVFLFVDKLNGPVYLIGILLNCLFYAFVLEMMICCIKNFRKPANSTP